ncbi:MAG TPA: pyruvate formate-lyase-activating protein [Kiritimatiellia bacterium]|nr:pyruvate formate-lyase-activating protein [Kiritimatiellia bacterium]HPC49279.1 pyruvate formate-lyase-activating protein [Kiritimatiellia bacterium]
MNPQVTGRIHSIESFGTLDGPGIRYVLFLQGCPLRCLYCHNPDAGDCEAGRVITAGEALADILTYRAFIARGGVTLSGGEPLLQPEFVCALLEGCREQCLHTALDTSGAIPLSISRAALDRADLILLDVKAIDDDLCRTLTGRGNRETLATLEYCEAAGREVWVRHVLVPGYTLDPAHLTRLADHLLRYACIRKVELLPFHKMGEYKWEALQRPYRLSDTPPPTEEEVQAARAIFEQRGLL